MATAGPSSDSLPDAVLGFLRASGLADPRAQPAARRLTGGVSSDIWRVDLPCGAVCVKRALPRLRVEQTWEAPVERNCFERRWMEVANGIVAGLVPRVLAHDPAGVFAMEYLDAQTHPLWKAELRAGRADPGFAARVGDRLGRVHAATAGRADLAQAFATDASFHALRLEPYLLATARRHADLAPALHALVARTAQTRCALVHGDVSPKNILVGPRGPVFLDAECAWYGDPAFDVAVCLNHLLLKCLWAPSARDAFLGCFEALAAHWRARIDWEPAEAAEARAARLLPALALARVDGKSPVEYLDAAAQDCVRRFARPLVERPVDDLDRVRSSWQGAISG